MLSFIEEGNSNKVNGTIIWLHGLGSSGSDFKNISKAMKISEKINVRYIFPNAPEIPVTVNSYQIMPAWYDICEIKLTDRQDIIGIKNSEKLIAELIYNEYEKGVPYNRIILAGFSQGCAMALYTGLKFPQKLAGIIALSGYLPLSEEFEKYTFKPNLKTPIFFGHGLLDEIVKPEWGRASERLLKDLGYEPNWNEYKIDHSICLEEILDFSVFINQMLNP